MQGGKLRGYNLLKMLPDSILGLIFQNFLSRHAPDPPRFGSPLPWNNGLGNWNLLSSPHYKHVPPYLNDYLNSYLVLTVTHTIIVYRAMCIKRVQPCETIANYPWCDMATSVLLNLPHPEITINEFHQVWTRFELAAKSVESICEVCK